MKEKSRHIFIFEDAALTQHTLDVIITTKDNASNTATDRLKAFPRINQDKLILDH